MRISFKDVGQGDSIIVEWKDSSDKEKIGIIDCNKKGKTNPVLEYIKANTYKEISFLILSHPHDDHYSGYLELLEYIEESNIEIIRFAHTIGFTGVQAYWKYFEINTEAIDLISSIKKKWIALNKAGIIKQINDLTVNVTLQIDELLSITCISPSHADIQEYQKRIDYDNGKDEKAASRAANLLSTTLKISYNDFNFLLTSDTENFAFLGAWNREPHHFRNVRFHICQLAHHGSYNNYDPNFWSNIVTFKTQYAIASAGKKYNHPSFKVLEAFNSAGYKVYSTSVSNGMIEFIKMMKSRSHMFDTFSKLAEEYVNSGDRVFEIKEGDIVRIQ